MSQTIAGILPTKRWGQLIPIAFITYSLAYLDRANYGFGAAAGLAEDLNITPGISSLLGALFFLGYFCFQVPGGIYVEKHSAKRLIFWSLILWGMLATATGMVHNVALLAAIRFLLGVAESVVMPAMLIFLSHWFTRAERSKANTFLFLGNPITVLWMSILSGYLVNSFGWRDMFIIEGVPAILWAFIWWAVYADRPKDVKWLVVAGAMSFVLCRLFRRAGILCRRVDCRLSQRLNRQPSGILCVYGRFAGGRRAVNRVDHVQQPIPNLDAHLKCLLKQAHS